MNYQKNKYKNRGQATLKAYAKHKVGHFLVGGTLAIFQKKVNNYMDVILQKKETSSEDKIKNPWCKDFQKTFLIGGISAVGAELVGENIASKKFATKTKMRDIGANAGIIAGSFLGYVMGDTQTGHRTSYNAIKNNFLETSTHDIIWMDEIADEIDEALFVGGREKLLELFLKKDVITKKEDGSYFCTKTNRFSKDPLSLLNNLISSDEILYALVNNIIPISRLHHPKHPKFLKKMARATIIRLIPKNYFNMTWEEVEGFRIEVQCLRNKYLPKDKKKIVSRIRNDYIETGGENTNFFAKKRLYLKKFVKKVRLKRELEKILEEPENQNVDINTIKNESPEGSRTNVVLKEIEANKKAYKKAKKRFEKDPLYIKANNEAIELTETLQKLYDVPDLDYYEKGGIDMENRLRDLKKFLLKFEMGPKKKNWKW